MSCKLILLYPQGKANPDYAKIQDELIQKIKHVIAVVDQPLKSKKTERDDAALKKKSEGEQILKSIESGDEVILFDEKGKAFGGSRDFAAALAKKVESGKKRIVFVIGGPFGVSEEVKQRANQTWSLGALTFNHHLAKLMILEQVYRSTTIWKNIPYHND